jgi:hypothetical protein
MWPLLLGDGTVSMLAMQSRKFCIYYYFIETSQNYSVVPSGFQDLSCFNYLAEHMK